MSTILITGSSSGLGLAFLKHYLPLPTTTSILAIDLHPLPPLPPSLLPHASKLTTWSNIDIANASSLSPIVHFLANKPLHLILHCAGIRGLVPSIVAQQKGDVAAAETLQTMEKETMIRTFEINTWGTLNTVRTFLPNLLLCNSTSTSTSAADSSPAPTVPKVIILSSRMGSISANTTGGGYAYRASKAALNAVVTSLAIDVPEVVFLMLHPGRVETGLVEWKEEGAISVEESLGTCLRVIEEVGKEGSGRLVDRWGSVIAW
ncbi:NAD(P)-binding protein [Amniculicola lignicola CBS 123094]|uniref:NAD(P)-binding protein n=1 Tax=Amniculicola lignicola CBS 123094 TaxID=1392246 RepID=A0A6A5WUJ3_9PLEO|nr:NAD(P)-binding protein [Amniculicola lignicola CBS 123094]